MREPELWPLDRLLATDLGSAALYASRAVAERAGSRLGLAPADSLDALPDGLDTLVVVGGGRRMDEAKLWRADNAPGMRLVVIPSLWGSGAEVSPVVALNGAEGKEVRVDARLLPDVRCPWPELADCVPEDTARHACGDTWSHALEGFLSPLADDAVRAELAGAIHHLLDLPIGKDPRWFQASARACRGQARSGVGLVHGIAHTLEVPLRREQPAAAWGHARLCAVFLLPVMSLNRSASQKWSSLLGEHEIAESPVLATLVELFDEEAYDQALTTLESRWEQVLRDPCTRMNSTLVRRTALGYFEGKEFLG